jgi:hypothetical protein
MTLGVAFLTLLSLAALGPFYGTRVQRIVAETPVESTSRCRKRSITPDPPQRVRALKEMGAARVEKVPPIRNRPSPG